MKLTTDPATKFVPLTVRAKSRPPADTLVIVTSGTPPASVVIVGTGTVWTVRLTALEMPPAGAGLVTVIGKVPTATTSVLRICAVICVALTKVVTRARPLKLTTELLLKFVPLTVSTNVGSPAVTLGGEIVVIVGTGLLIVKSRAGADVPPPGVGFVTVTGTTPAVTSSAGVMSALT